jgi:hypothetical protein
MLGRTDVLSKYGEAGEAEEDDELKVGDEIENSESIEFICCVADK